MVLSDVLHPIIRNLFKVSQPGIAVLPGQIPVLDHDAKEPFDCGPGGGHLLPDTIPPPSAAATGGTAFADKRRRKVTDADGLTAAMRNYPA